MTNASSEWELVQALSRDIAEHPLHPSLDCTEIVERFIRVSARGKCRYVTVAGNEPQWFRIWEQGHWVSFLYHAVYELDGMVFDPYWQPDPMVSTEYMTQVQVANPDVMIIWRDELPSNFT